MKESKRYREWRLRHLHPAKPPEAILSSWSVTQFDQADLERARWVWERRPKNVSLFGAGDGWRALWRQQWRRHFCICHVLVDFSLVSGLVLVFICGRQSDQWAQLRSDYSRAIDRLLFRQS